MATALVRVTQAVTPAAIPATVTHIRLTDYANCALTWRQAMPFDGIEFALDDRLSKMDQVISLLDAPNKWCKGVLKTYDGKYCLRGAIMAVHDGLSLQPVVLRAIREVTGKHYLRIEGFNDRAETDHDQVLAVLERARNHLISAHLGHRSTSALVTWREKLPALLNVKASKPA